MAYVATKTHLPPGCGEDLAEPLLYNPYQQQFQEARRQRFCLNCKTMGAMDENSRFICQKCQTAHTSNLTAPRAYDRFLILAGRGGGKTLIGAHAAREEMMVPNSIGWVMGPTYKVLHDSTFPTLVRRIPPHWVKRWDPEHMEIRLQNGALVAFRSLEDPERARGPHGVSWGWFDEAAQAPERAYDVFEPTLIKAGGIVIATTTVLGYDWTYEKIEKRALTYKEPGFWACKYWTEENPLFKANPVMMAQIERARRTMPPDFFNQEYRSERHNASGLIYDYKVLSKQWLADAQAVQRLIPEWPQIDPSRPVIIGLDSGVDHPFGAVLIVATPGGLVVVKGYLKRQQALTTHFEALRTEFNPSRFQNVKWAANKNEANLRLEFGLRGVGVIQAENKHEVGIQRVASWLHSGQLYFAYTAPEVFEQMRAYRYAENTAPDGQKKAKEQVFKQKDEYPDAVRYALMAWPALPTALEPTLTEGQQRRWDTLDEKSRQDIEWMRAYHKGEREKVDLDPASREYPLGSFYSPMDVY